MCKVLKNTYKEAVVDIPKHVGPETVRKTTKQLGLQGVEDLASYYLFFVISFSESSSLLARYTFVTIKNNRRYERRW